MLMLRSFLYKMFHLIVRAIHAAVLQVVCAPYFGYFPTVHWNMMKYGGHALPVAELWALGA